MAYSEQYYNVDFTVDLSSVIYDGGPDAIESFLRERNAVPTVEDAQNVTKASKLGPDFDIRFAGGAYLLDENTAGADVMIVNAVDRTISIDGVQVDFDQHTDGQISFTHNEHIFLINFKIELDAKQDGPSRSLSGFIAPTSSADQKQEISGIPHSLSHDDITTDELAVILDLIPPMEPSDPANGTHEGETGEPSESVESRNKHKARDLAEKAAKYSPTAIAWVINRTAGDYGSYIGTIFKFVGEKLLTEYAKSQQAKLTKSARDLKLKNYDIDKRIHESVEFESNYDHFAEAAEATSIDRVFEAVMSDYKLEMKAQAEKALKGDFRFLYYLKGTEFTEALDQAIDKSWERQHNSVHTRILDAIGKKLKKMTPQTRADRMLSRLNGLKRELDNMKREEIEDGAKPGGTSDADHARERIREAREKTRREFERQVEEMENDLQEHEGAMTQKMAERMAEKANKLEEKNNERKRERERLLERERLIERIRRDARGKRLRERK
ncbi:hypothetical protein V8C37DRAFT_364275 [Trichoderma ceciliae]